MGVTTHTFRRLPRDDVPVVHKRLESLHAFDDDCAEFRHGTLEQHVIREQREPVVPTAFIDEIRIGHNVIDDRQPVSHEHRIGIDGARVVSPLNVQAAWPGDVLVGHEVLSTHCVILHLDSLF